MTALRIASLLWSLAVVLLLPQAVRAQIDVDVELVLATDASQSMDHDELLLQRQGYVQALEHPDVWQAVRLGFTGRIAITYVSWGNARPPEILLPWTLIESQQDLLSVAGKLASAPIGTIRGTAIGRAVDFAADLFDANGYEGYRKVVDISGDGPNSSGPPVEPARDEAIGRGIIINGLPLIFKDPGFSPWSIPDLDLYYQDCVIGGPGSFVLPVRQLADFPEAVRRKLVLEIAGLPPRVQLAQFRNRPKMDCLIGEKLRSRWMDP